VTASYGIESCSITGNGACASSNLDKAFFSLFEEEDDIVLIVEELHQKHYALCKLLDFRLYY
ncbi:MAG TPA: hypothetical protein PLH20_14290, partial [Flavobacterium sp.]|nr:hypothetical protein [Flavobacterium sp.]